MWPPPNIQSLPSKKEIQSVKNEISTIKLEIIETELRLDALRKSLLERKVWIAPIRTMPPEILSLIFNEASRNDWKVPLVLQSVSRRWRDVVVDSPEAWAFINLSKCSSERRSELILLFLERSRNTPLHISIGNDSLLRYIGFLRSRIECIHLEPTKTVLLSRYLQHGHTFRRLEKLKIDTWNLLSDAPATDDPAAWNMLLFPNLKALDIRSASFSFFRAISAAPEFPAIQHLTIDCQSPGRLAGILTKCATSLESVDLTYDTLQSEGFDTEHEAHFPHLRYLRLIDLSHEDEARFRFKAATPNLQAYLDDGATSTLNTFKVDTGSVILLHVLRTPNLFEYPRLVNLCFVATHSQNEEFVLAIESLSANPAICPDLASIEYIGQPTREQMQRVSLALLTREQVTGQTIQLMNATFKMWEEHAQKKRVHMFREIEPCGNHMPCNL